VIGLIAIAAAFIGAKYDWPVGVGAGLVAWLAHGWFFPWTSCAWCKGNVKHTSETGKSWNVWCWGSLLGQGCGGDGKRRRWASLLLRGGFGKL
jgi:hypothetical protein